MKLIDWMQKSNTSIEKAAELFGCSIYAIRKWLRGERTPRPAMQSKIKKATKAAVGGDDWLDE